MRGGMGGSKGEWGTIGQRASGQPAGGPQPAAEHSAAQHVDVEWGTFWQPGVLSQWVQTPDGWYGLCAWVDTSGHLQADLVPAGRLRRNEA